MGKLGGIILVSALALAGCASAPAAIEPASQIKQLPASVQSEMLSELRPLLKTLKASDSELVQEAFIACGNLTFRDKDAYRKAVLAQHPNDLALSIDHLTVAAAGKQYLCP